MDVIDKFEAEFGFGNKFNIYVRKCDTCSQPMNFGWILGEEYACSEKCAIKNIGLEQWNKEMKTWEDEGDNDYVYHTHWECMDDVVDSEGFYYNEKGEEIDCTVKEAVQILSKSDYYKIEVSDA
jgi:endogenous inhibitor of DNA gyrase (YacG/DUF329 family)|tara:strand:+ start:198 stop:569 length:372 start_codon:yes stop_codon:yes gene_type:complete